MDSAKENGECREGGGPPPYPGVPLTAPTGNGQALVHAAGDGTYWAARRWSPLGTSETTLCLIPMVAGRDLRVAGEAWAHRVKNEQTQSLFRASDVRITGKNGLKLCCVTDMCRANNTTGNCTMTAALVGIEIGNTTTSHHRCIEISHDGTLAK